MDSKQDLLLNINTNINNKGPYKVTICKDNNIISTLKIRMKDDVTYIVKLNKGDYNLNLLKNNNLYLKNSFSLPRFEAGSELKVNINDQDILFNYQNISEYKSVEDIMKLIEDKGNKSNKCKKKVKSKYKNKNLDDLNSFENNIKTSNDKCNIAINNEEKNTYLKKEEHLKLEDNCESEVIKSQNSIKNENITNLKSQEDINIDLYSKINNLTKEIDRLKLIINDFKKENIEVNELKV